MALTETRPETRAESVGRAIPRTPATAAERVLGTGNHTTIGRTFIGASLLFVALDLLMAALVHIDTVSGNEILDGPVALRLFMNHPLGLLLCGVLPLVLGLAIALVPLQLGSPAIAFPRAAALSLWGWLLGSVLFGVAVAADGSYGGANEKLARLGNVSVGLICLSLMVGTVCVMVTVLSLRLPGMTVGRVPFFSFSMLVAGAVWLTTLPVVLAGVTLWHIQHPSAAELASGGFASLDWLFRQPSIFMVAIPVLGIVLDVASAASSSRVRFYAGMQSMIVAAGVLSFGAWAQAPFARETFVWVLGALVVGLPVLVVTAGVVDTVRSGSPKFTAGLVMSVSALPILLLAAVTALVQAVATVGDGELYTVAVGGFARVKDATGIESVAGSGLAIGQVYLVIAAVVVAGAGACFAWGARLWPGGLPDGLGKALAPLGLLAGALFGLAQVVIGIATPDADGQKVLLGVAGAGAALLCLVALATCAAVTSKLRPHDVAPDGDPAGGTLEWSGDTFTGSVESPYPLFDRAETGA